MSKSKRALRMDKCDELRIMIILLYLLAHHKPSFTANGHISLLISASILYTFPKQNYHIYALTN